MITIFFTLLKLINQRSQMDLIMFVIEKFGLNNMFS